MYHAHVPCAKCGSLRTQHGFDEVTCLVCGALTRLQANDGVGPTEPHSGSVVPPEVQYTAKNM